MTLDLAVALTFDLSHRAEVLLEAVVELGISDGLKVTGVDASRGCGIAAFTHAGVVAQATLVQVRVSQGVLRRNPLGLEVENNRDLRNQASTEHFSDTSDNVANVGDARVRAPAALVCSAFRIIFSRSQTLMRMKGCELE